MFDSGFLHSSVTPVVHTIFNIKGKTHSYFGGAMLEHRLKELLKEDNPNHTNSITNALIKDIIGKILKALTRKQFETFFSNEENIEKMKAK